ncbi:hypothetical protein NE237_001229 [Protea cynaroides]|uniref:Uncharacterized protein n=1 Tax=Protea cynaroides TaxID=273540 RepID=A0A9Q0QXX3_9MAGN|nr:hypothetical protein NE237_001229 [Protea cynaroides]
MEQNIIKVPNEAKGRDKPMEEGVRVDHRRATNSNLGRWADVEDEDGPNEDNEENFQGALTIPIEVNPLVEGHSGDDVDGVEGEIPIMVNELPIQTSPGGAVSAITTSLGRVEIVFDDIMAVDESLQGGDFPMAGKKTPSKQVGRGKKHGDDTAPFDNTPVPMELLLVKSRFLLLL